MSQGFTPTGKKLKAELVGVFRVVNGKLVEGWFINDELNMFKQIGAIEITEKEKKVVKRDNMILIILQSPSKYLLHCVFGF